MITLYLQTPRSDLRVGTAKAFEITSSNQLLRCLNQLGKFMLLPIPE